MNSNALKYKLLEITWATIALAAGGVVIYLGNQILDVSMDVFYGVHTFNPRWITNLFLVPFLAGIVVALIYGLGGKIIAHLAPLPIMLYNYLTLDKMLLPEGVVQLPIYYWALVVIVAMEFAGIGGVVGEILIKKTYGRRPKQYYHVRYQKGLKERLSGKQDNKADEADLSEG